PDGSGTITPPGARGTRSPGPGPAAGCQARATHRVRCSNGQARGDCNVMALLPEFRPGSMSTVKTTRWRVASDFEDTSRGPMVREMSCSCFCTCTQPG